MDLDGSDTASHYGHNDGVRNMVDVNLNIITEVGEIWLTSTPRNATFNVTKPMYN